MLPKGTVSITAILGNKSVTWDKFYQQPTQMWSPLTSVITKTVGGILNKQINTLTNEQKCKRGTLFFLTASTWNTVLGSH